MGATRARSAVPIPVMQQRPAPTVAAQAATRAPATPGTVETDRRTAAWCVVMLTSVPPVGTTAMRTRIAPTP